MTRADIEEMLHNLAATARDLQDSGRPMREAADHMVTVTITCRRSPSAPTRRLPPA